MLDGCFFKLCSISSGFISSLQTTCTLSSNTMKFPSMWIKSILFLSRSLSIIDMHKIYFKHKLSYPFIRYAWPFQKKLLTQKCQKLSAQRNSRTEIYYLIWMFYYSACVTNISPAASQTTGPCSNMQTKQVESNNIYPFSKYLSTWFTVTKLLWV